MTDETLQLARSAAADLRRKGQRRLAEAVERLVEASEPEAVPSRSYLTSTQAGELLGVAGETIKNWVREGKLQGYRVGGRISVPRAAVATYVQRARGFLDLEDVPEAEEAVVVAADESQRLRGQRPDLAAFLPDPYGPHFDDLELDHLERDLPRDVDW